MAIKTRTITTITYSTGSTIEVEQVNDTQVDITGTNADVATINIVMIPELIETLRACLLGASVDIMEGWHPYKGGVRPVPNNIYVNVLTRPGDIKGNVLSCGVNWSEVTHYQVYEDQRTGWKGWNGDVEGSLKPFEGVIVKFRDGSKSNIPRPSYEFRWGWNQNSGDIVAYKVIS